MRVSLGLFLVLGLFSVGCGKKDPDPQAIGSDNGIVLGEGTPQGAAVPVQGVVTPTKQLQPTQLARPAFAAIGATTVGGTPVGVVPPAPTQPAAAQQGVPPGTPAPVAPAAKPATPAAATPPAATNPAVAGRGVPPPPGGRPKPGTK